MVGQNLIYLDFNKCLTFFLTILNHNVKMPASNVKEHCTFVLLGIQLHHFYEFMSTYFYFLLTRYSSIIVCTSSGHFEQ